MVSPRELFQQALIENSNKHYEKAKKIYREVLKIDPHYSMAWNNLGWILHDQFQDYKEAEKCYRKAIKEDSRNYYAWNNLGILQYRVKKKYKEAKHDWEEAIAINPHFVMALNNLAVYYEFQEANKEKADQIRKKAKMEHPSTGSPQEVLKCPNCHHIIQPNQEICEICGLTIK